MRAASCLGVEGDRAALAVDAHALDVERHARQVQRQAARPDAGAERGEDPAPRRIAAEDPGLDQAAARDRARQIARHGALGHARDVDHQQLGRPLAVGGDGARQVARTARSASPAASRSRRCRARSPRAPERPLASTITASLVDMSPSTVMVLNVSSTASVSAACSTAGATVASVAMKHEHRRHLRVDHPRALGDRRELDRACRRRRSRGRRPWCVRSVVRIASAAVMTSSPSAATSAGTAAAIRSTGRRMPIAPVDAVSTVSASTPSPAATAVATARSSTAPRGPGDRVGVAAVGDDRADAHRGQPARAVVDGRGAHPVDGEQPGRRARASRRRSAPRRAAPRPPA